LIKLCLKDFADSDSIQALLVAGGLRQGAAVAKTALFARCGSKLVDSGIDDNTPAIGIFVPGRIEVLGKHRVIGRIMPGR